MEVTVKPDEQVLEWQSLEDLQVQMVVAACVEAIPTVRGIDTEVKKERFRQLLNLGKPRVVFGPNYKYCRIHQDSVDEMKVIIDQYYL